MRAKFHEILRHYTQYTLRESSPLPELTRTNFAYIQVAFAHVYKAPQK